MSIAESLPNPSVILSYLLDDDDRPDGLPSQTSSSMLTSQAMSFHAPYTLLYLIFAFSFRLWVHQPNSKGVHCLPRASSTPSFHEPVGYLKFLHYCAMDMHHSYISIKDEMLEPDDNQASSVALFGSNLSSWASIPPKPTSVVSDRPEPSPSASYQQNASSSGRARRVKRKRVKWKEKLQHKAAEIKPSKKQEASAAHLANRLARTKSTIAAPFTVSSIPKTRSGFIASLRDTDKAEVIRLRNDVEYFRETVRSLQPVPYRYLPPASI